MKRTHVHINASRSVHHHEYQPTWDWVTQDYVQSPQSDKHEAAHYVADNALSTQCLEEWL